MNFRSILNAAFPPFSESRREKPREMLFSVAEHPGLLTTLTVGAQHTLIVLTMLVYTVVIGKQIGLTDTELRGFVALEIVVMGLVTLLQSLPTRFGSGHLIVHTPSVISMAAFIAVANSFGLGAAMGGILLSSVVVIFLSGLLPRFRSLFPVEVIGVLLVLLGLTLVEGGVTRFTGLHEGSFDMPTLLTASVTLGVIVAFSVWSPGRLRVFAVLAGIAAGLMVASLTGLFGDRQMDVVWSEPLFALPFGGFEIPTPTLILAAALPQLLIEVISAVDSIGTAVTIDKMDNARWTRPDMRMVGRTITAHGFGLMMNGVTGTPPLGTSSANLGLVAVTGVAARVVGSAAGILLVVLAFLPQVSAFITTIPRPIIGALIVYTAGYLMVVGMELILSRLLNSRRQFMVGLGVTVGVSLMVIPELASGVPGHLQPVLGSALIMGVVTAVVLNQIFRIGVSQTAAVELSGLAAAHDAAEFLEDRGAAWGARRDVISRAGIAVGEVLEVLHNERMAEGPVNLQATFDEYRLLLLLDYPGTAFNFSGDQALDLAAFLESDEDEDELALDAAMSQMSGALIQNLADKVSSSKQGEQATLRMEFSH
jgi:xanthine/uracil permease